MRFSVAHAVVGEAIYGSRYKPMGNNLHQLDYGKGQF